MGQSSSKNLEKNSRRRLKNRRILKTPVIRKKIKRNRSERNRSEINRRNLQKRRRKPMRMLWRKTMTARRRAAKKNRKATTKKLKAMKSLKRMKSLKAMKSLLHKRSLPTLAVRISKALTKSSSNRGHLTIFATPSIRPSFTHSRVQTKSMCDRVHSMRFATMPLH